MSNKKFYFEGPDGGLCIASDRKFADLEGWDEISEAKYNEFKANPDDDSSAAKEAEAAAAKEAEAAAAKEAEAAAAKEATTTE